MSDDYVRKLEETVKIFMEPFKNIPFSIVIKTISGHNILPFNTNNQVNLELLEILRSACEEAMQTAHTQGIISKRANEVGNKIEPFVKTALNNNGVTADTPINSIGIRQPTAYPDILIERPNGEKIYLECKTYNINNVDTTHRAFYFQASENSKIMHDAMHLMVSFEIETAQRNGANVFVPVSWKIYCLEGLLVQMKSEFNASNRDMYGVNGLPLLAEGRI